jgi:Fe-S-cluster containining protein
MTWQKATGNERCVNCGKCCANILMLSDREIQNIKQFLKENPSIQVHNHNTIMLQEDVNICPFLRQDKDLTYCAIYEVRPSICRSFSCNPKYNVDMNYDGVKAINMLLTFGGKNQFTINPPDLTMINKRIKFLQDKIKKNKRGE